ncbi:AAA family ATPase [Kitasatospora sp. NBC_01287]|uniref:AAA family ATPase n=1 Tax=Kitasatospora sp. NBC_01287 TaxID=2903573 RepID=UPI00224F0458|nr:ATP-binding protein [Kitasatospora sp. NBC_01287]MCX4747825.1 AAA family ATPase [Kitasatospora sp. NBC_01287]
MLLSFRIANFRSLRDEQDLDLRCVYRKEERALRVAAIYGSNASGKSNVLNALKFMHDAITEQNREWLHSPGTPRVPFLLDEESRSRPTSFAVDFIASGTHYSYGFGIDGSVVTDEWLHRYEGDVEEVVFDRRLDQYTLGARVKSPRLELLQDITPGNGLFVSYAARAKIEVLQDVFDWFHKKLWFINDELSNERVRRQHTAGMLDSAEASDRVRRMIRAADLGISNVRTISHVPVLGPEYADALIKLSVESQPAAELVDFQVAADAAVRQLRPQKQQTTVFEHSGERDAEFSFGDESKGTRTWFGLIGFVLDALDQGHTLVVDELDTSLHPLLVGQLVRLFQGPESNPNAAQLIFTSHDVSLLGRRAGEEILRRDEIWFTEKGADGASEIFPLTDFKPPQGLNWERRYLGGSIGAIPKIAGSALADASRSTASQADE